MSDPPSQTDGHARTGHFVLQVARRGGETGSWCVRIEAVESGTWAEFDSLQEALWFLSEHLAVEDDGESDRDLFSRLETAARMPSPDLEALLSETD